VCTFRYSRAQDRTVKDSLGFHKSCHFDNAFDGRHGSTSGTFTTCSLDVPCRVQRNLCSQLYGAIFNDSMDNAGDWRVHHIEMDCVPGGTLNPSVLPMTEDIRVWHHLQPSTACRFRKCTTNKCRKGPTSPTSEFFTFIGRDGRNKSPGCNCFRQWNETSISPFQVDFVRF
jgi:hypothetical protein